MSASAVLWDVDTQVDFVHADGCLAVPGAESAVPAMSRLVEWARRTGVVHIASADDHEPTDPELSVAPDFVTTFPSHCLRDTPGARRIPETQQLDPVVLAAAGASVEDIRRSIAGRMEILLLKQRFDVFTNPSADAVLDVLDPEEVIVFGVATDVCVRDAIVGMLERGRRVAFVEDACRGLDEARTRACLEHWRNAGVRFATSNQVVQNAGGA